MEALLLDMLSDKLGRKRPLIVSGMLFTVSAVGMGMADSFFAYNAYRIVGGLGMGGVILRSLRPGSEFRAKNLGSLQGLRGGWSASASMRGAMWKSKAAADSTVKALDLPLGSSGMGTGSAPRARSASTNASGASSSKPIRYVERSTSR